MLVARYKDKKVDSIGGFDARGFVLGPPLALALEITGHVHHAADFVAASRGKVEVITQAAAEHWGAAPPTLQNEPGDPLGTTRERLDPDHWAVPLCRGVFELHYTLL